MWRRFNKHTGCTLNGGVRRIYMCKSIIWIFRPNRGGTPDRYTHFLRYILLFHITQNLCIYLHIVVHMYVHIDIYIYISTLIYMMYLIPRIVFRYQCSTHAIQQMGPTRVSYACSNLVFSYRSSSIENKGQIHKDFVKSINKYIYLIRKSTNNRYNITKFSAIIIGAIFPLNSIFEDLVLHIRRRTVSYNRRH